MARGPRDLARGLEEGEPILFGDDRKQGAIVGDGFEKARGQIIVTLDADLQNPPEEIGRLIARMREGHDYVGSIRRRRRDSLFRSWASKAMNHLREKITRIRITDQGNMLRAYSRSVVNAINACLLYTSPSPRD